MPSRQKTDVEAEGFHQMADLEFIDGRTAVRYIVYSCLRT
jgi:hypothetical protein